MDASVVVAALVDSGAGGVWAEGLLVEDDLAAPHLMPVEVANILRRSAISGQITSETASAAHQDLLDLRVALFPYGSFGPRVWELRANVTAYDASYIALAESLHAPLATLDRQLASASGPTCFFMTPYGQKRDD